MSRSIALLALLARKAPGPAVTAALALLLLMPGGHSQAEGGAPATLDRYSERLESELVLKEVWQGELAMTDFYPLDYVLAARHEVAAKLRCAVAGGPRRVEYTAIEGAHAIGSKEQPGEEAPLESVLEDAVVAFHDANETRLVEGRDAARPLLAGLCDGFDRSAFGPPADLGNAPSWSLRDDEALALFDATGPLGLEFEDLAESAQEVVLLSAPFELRALLAGDQAPRAELELTRGEPRLRNPHDEPLALVLKADGVSDLLPQLVEAARQVEGTGLWDGITKLEATWTLEAKGTASWDAERRVLHDIELEGELTVSAELTSQPNDPGLAESTFVLDIAGTLAFVSEHVRD